jgi:hypothetical protein
LGTLSNIQTTKKTCYKCNSEFNSYLNSDSYSIICPGCGVLYTSYNGALDKTTEVIKKVSQALDIPLGTTGTIKNIKYLVIGYAYKKENGTIYHWHEYTLFNPIHGVAFLAMFDGHWTYLTELNSLPQESARIATYDNIDYDLYSKYNAKLVSASGEFVYRISQTEIPSVQEYIEPPLMISKEKTSDNITWYRGEYIQPEEIKKGFDLANITERTGIGMIQPFLGKFKTESLRRLIMFLIILWGLAQFYFLSAAKEEQVFSQSFNITDSLNKKEIYSKPFDLKYGTANAEVKISANIDNNWMYTAVTLVNEKTGDLYDVDLEAEYYHGYEGGENWTEGNNWTSKVVSQVPEGQYYMIIYPEKPTNMSNVYLTVSVTRDVFVFSNGLFVLILLAIFPIYYFNRKDSFEKKRWYNSNYSPYDDEDN